MIHKISNGKHGFVKTEMSIELLKCIFENCSFTQEQEFEIIRHLTHQCTNIMKDNPLPIINTEF